MLDTFGTLTIATMIVHRLLSMGSRVVGALDGTYPNGDDLLTAVWQTLVCGLGWNGKRTQDSDKNHFKTFLSCYQDQLMELFASDGRRVSFLSVGTRLVRNQAELADSRQDTRTRSLMNEPIPTLSPELEQRAQLEDEMYPFLATMLHYQAERRICITGKGYFGTIPREAEEGDVIAIFFGLRIPFVLRPLAGGRYKLVGPCYVHGIMDGEGLQINNEGLCRVESVDFVLA
jgi:hypothetical protein